MSSFQPDSWTALLSGLDGPASCSLGPSLDMILSDPTKNPDTPIPRCSSRWNNGTACHQLAARMHMRSYARSLGLCVDIYISACAVSHLGLLLRLLGTHCGIVLVTIPHIRGAVHSGWNPHPISLPGPSLNCTPVITIIIITIATSGQPLTVNLD